MRPPLLCCCLLLLGHGLHGHLLPPTGGDAVGTGEPPELEVGPRPASPNASSAHQVLLDSLSGWLPQPGLPREGVSCRDLLPEALEGFSELPPLPQTLASLALALSLQGAGCPGQAEALVVRLYGEVGTEDVNALLSGIAGAPQRGGRSQAALFFNLDQLAGASPRRCSGLARLHGSLLLGPVTSAHATFPAAAAACSRLGSACAGLAANGTTSFLVIGRPGAYSLPGRGARAWLHRCSQAGRSRRGSPEACSSEQEQGVHGVLEWLPGVSTFYNVGTSIYYAFQNCPELAKERAREAALDIGYDALVVLTGGAGGGVGFAVGVGLKPAVKAGVKSLIRYFEKANAS